MCKITPKKPEKCVKMPSKTRNFVIIPNISVDFFIQHCYNKNNTN